MISVEQRAKLYQGMLNEALFIATQSEGIISMDFILSMPLSYRKQQVEFWLAQKEKRDQELEQRKADMDARRHESAKNKGKRKTRRR